MVWLHGVTGNYVDTVPWERKHREARLSETELTHVVDENADRTDSLVQM